jgi:hypothetical protein
VTGPDARRISIEVHLGLVELKCDLTAEFQSVHGARGGLPASNHTCTAI